MTIFRNTVLAIAAMGLAAAVFAADQVTNTNPAETTETAVTQTTATATQEKVNVNTATAKELMKVKGINAAKAKALIVYRKSHGDFKSLEDLKEVKYFKKMNEDKLQEIQNQLTVG